MNGLMPEFDDEEPDLMPKSTSLLARRGKMRELLSTNQLEQASVLLKSFFTKQSTKQKEAAKHAELYMTTLSFIDRVIEKDFANAVQLLKHKSFKTTGAAAPVWDTKSKKATLRAVSSLAGLLCYSDPIEQCKGTQVGDWLLPETRRLI